MSSFARRSIAAGIDARSQSCFEIVEDGFVLRCRRYIVFLFRIAAHVEELGRISFVVVVFPVTAPQHEGRCRCAHGVIFAGDEAFSGIRCIRKINQRVALGWTLGIFTECGDRRGMNVEQRGWCLGHFACGYVRARCNE